MMNLAALRSPHDSRLITLTYLANPQWRLLGKPLVLDLRLLAYDRPRSH